VASELPWQLAMRIELTLLLGAAVASSGCGGDLLGNEGFEIDCDGQPCDWVVIEGDPARTASWHDGDAGFDLSGSGRVVIEQRSAPFALDGRELVLRAGVVRRGDAELGFELDWYVAGQGEGATYWDRDPLLVDSRGFAVDERGVFELEELISTPSLEVSGLALRAVKQGDGTAMVDEVSLSAPEVLP
jgi:hypothetical protein